MERLPAGAKIRVKWSDLGSPTKPGMVKVDKLEGQVVITEVLISEITRRGGDLEVELENWPSPTDHRNFWVIRGFAQPKTA